MGAAWDFFIFFLDFSVLCRCHFNANQTLWIVLPIEKLFQLEIQLHGLGGMKLTVSLNFARYRGLQSAINLLIDFCTCNV